METVPLPQPVGRPSARSAGVDLSTLPPATQQALAPFVLPRHQYGGLTYICEQTMRADQQRDAAALREQMNRPQTVEGWFV